MGGILGYDPLRLPALRTRLVEAIEDLAGITTWEPAADAAISCIARAQWLLECEHLPAVDAALASDAMERRSFGVGLRQVRRFMPYGGGPGPSDRTRRLLDIALAVALAARGPTGWEGLGDGELVDLLMQKCVLLVDLRSPEDLDALGRLSTEVLRRIGGADGSALLDRLAAELDEEAWSTLAGTADGAIELAAEQIADAGDDGGAEARGSLDVFGAMLLRVARHDGTALESLVAAAPRRPGLTYAVTDDSELAEDGDLVVALARASLIDGADERARTGVAPLGRVLAAERALQACVAHPDGAAALLLDGDAGAEILQRGLPLDEDVVDEVVTLALMRPWVQRRGEDKSLGASRYQAGRGIEIWRRIVGTSARGELRPGALRGGARSLAAYLPALDPALRAGSMRGATSRADQDVRATVGAARISIGSYGDVAGLVGQMAQDESAGPLLASTLSAYTGSAIDAAIEEAMLVDGDPTELQEEIGIELRAVSDLGRLVFDGIDTEEARLRTRHARDQAGDRMLASVVFGTIGFLARERRLYIATRPFHTTFQRAIDRTLTSEPPTLSRELALDQSHLFTIRFAEAMVRAGPDVRARLGLDQVSGDHWRDLDAAVHAYWTAPDDTTRQAALDSLVMLTTDDGLMTEASADVSTYENAARRVAEAAGVDDLR